MDASKIYGLCLGRLTHQIINAKRQEYLGKKNNGQILLESYNTGDIEDIIDILEIYDIEVRTYEGLKEKLEDLACTVSVLMREALFFDYTEKGHLGLYFSLKGEHGDKLHERIDADSIAAVV